MWEGEGGRDEGGREREAGRKEEGRDGGEEEERGREEKRNEEKLRLLNKKSNFLFEFKTTPPTSERNFEVNIFWI